MAEIDTAKIAELLTALMSTKNQVRQQAEKLYQQSKAAAPDKLMIGLLTVLGNEGMEEACRRQGAVLLRQLVSATSGEKDYAWARVAPQHKQEVAAELLRRFQAEPNPKLQQKVGDVIAKLAECVFDTEDQRGWLGQQGWAVLLPTVLQMANPSSNPNVSSCESAVRLLKDLVGPMKNEVVAAQMQIGVVLQSALVHAEMKIRCAATLLVCEMVGVLDKKSWAPLTATAGMLNQVLQQMAQASMEDELQECLQAYVEVASVEPDFFKQQLTTSMEPATLLSNLVKAREGVDESVRNLSLEWMATYAEKKPKWLTKSLPAFAPLALECCMHLMVEVEDGDAELQAWAARMDDEEGEEDADELFHAGMEVIDRLVEALGMDSVGAALFTAVGHFALQDAWQAKHAALAAVRQTVEYVENTEHVDEMAKLILQYVDHAHPRVRHMALTALGQLANDQAPHFQETWHQTVMPVLLRKMDDAVDRVAANAMSAFVSFGEELDSTLMLGYSHGFMEKLVARLQSTKHRMLQEESITSVAVIAGVIDKDFSQYYGGMMPLLKRLVISATGEKESRLRGKAFECMSLLGLAVGREQFLPDAQEAVAEMLKAPQEADDLQREYISEASARICKCLKADFAPFLPHLLPRIFSSLALEGEDVAATSRQSAAGQDEDDEDACVTVMTEGKLVKVNTDKFEEIVNAVDLLNTFGSEMEGAFFDWVPQCAKALMPLLSASDEETLLCDNARERAFLTWAVLIKCARAGAEDRKQPGTMTGELVRTILQCTCAQMEKDQDPDSLRGAADGLAECLRSAGPGALGGAELMQLTPRLFQLIDASFQRSAVIEKAKKERSAGAPPELQQQDEDEESESGEDEEQCRRSFQDVMGAMMEVAPAEFLPCLPECGQRMAQWLAVKQNRSLALFLACDLVHHLKEQSQPTWPTFMPAVFQSLADQDPDARTAAAWLVNLAAPLASFSQLAPEAFTQVAQIVSGPAPKKRDEKAKTAFDNAVAALLALAKDQASCCPPGVPAWQLVVSKLPLKDDEDEAKKVHKLVVDLVLEQHAGLLGADHAHLGKILSTLAEVFGQENLSTKETDERIVRIFHQLPRQSLMDLAGGFTEKQQKKIEKMLSSTPVAQHGG